MNTFALFILLFAAETDKTNETLLGVFIAVLCCAVLGGGFYLLCLLTDTIPNLKKEWNQKWDMRDNNKYLIRLPNGQDVLVGNPRSTTRPDVTQTLHCLAMAAAYLREDLERQQEKAQEQTKLRKQMIQEAASVQQAEEGGFANWLDEGTDETTGGAA